MGSSTSSVLETLQSGVKIVSDGAKSLLSKGSIKKNGSNRNNKINNESNKSQQQSQLKQEQNAGNKKKSSINKTKSKK